MSSGRTRLQQGDMNNINWKTYSTGRLNSAGHQQCRIEKGRAGNVFGNQPCTF